MTLFKQNLSQKLEYLSISIHLEFNEFFGLSSFILKAKNCKFVHFKIMTKLIRNCAACHFRLILGQNDLQSIYIFCIFFGNAQVKRKYSVASSQVKNLIERKWECILHDSTFDISNTAAKARLVSTVDCCCSISITIIIFNPNKWVLAFLFVFFAAQVNFKLVTFCALLPD